MNWYYATKDKRQAGPVDDAALQALLSSGEITPETLVWKQGMTGWASYASVTGLPPAVPAPDGTIRCAECGQYFPPEQLITLAGRSICAACKPVAVQKFQEGVVTFGRTADPEELWRMIRQRGYDFTIGSVISRAWELVKGNFWPCVGVTLLCYLIMVGANQVPCVGMLAVFLVQAQIMAGLYGYFLKQFRGQVATLNDAFDGFRRGYWWQALYMLIIFVISMVCIIPLIVLFVAMSASKPGEDTLIWVTVGLFAVLLPVLWYFMLALLFAPILILDKGLTAPAAMKLSWRVVNMRFWKILGLFIVLGLIGLLGILALIIGVIFVMPVGFAAIVRLYEDIFGEEGTSASA